MILKISDEFKEFFSKYGKVADHEIIRDHATKRSRGFGFIVFDSEKVVDDLLSNGNMIDVAGTKVSCLQWFSIAEVGRDSYVLYRETARSCSLVGSSSGNYLKFHLYLLKIIKVLQLKEFISLRSQSLAQFGCLLINFPCTGL